MQSSCFATHTHTTHADPYAIISFERYTDRTFVQKQTVSPKWDQSFLIHNIHMYGNPSVIFDKPPSIVIKFYDEDKLVRMSTIDPLIGYPTGCRCK